MDQKYINEMAKMLEISPTAMRLYLGLVTKGELVEKELEKLVDSTPDEKNKAIDELYKRHLISQFKNKTGSIFAARTILQMQSHIEQQQKMVENIKNFVFPKLYSTKRFFQFRGWDEIRQVYTELLQEAHSSKTCFLSLENNMVNDSLGKEFVDNYIDLRIKYKVKAYVICPGNKEDLQYKNKVEGKLTEIKFIPDFVVDENIEIVGDVVMSFSPDTLEGDFHRNKSKANTLRSVFWNIWNKN